VCEHEEEIGSYKGEDPMSEVKMSWWTCLLWLIVKECALGSLGALSLGPEQAWLLFAFVLAVLVERSRSIAAELAPFLLRIWLSLAALVVPLLPILILLVSTIAT